MPMLSFLEPPHKNTVNAELNSSLSFVNGGLFLDTTLPSSFVHLISFHSFSKSRHFDALPSCFKPRGFRVARRPNNRAFGCGFSFVSLRNDGYVEDPKGEASSSLQGKNILGDRDRDRDRVDISNENSGSEKDDRVEMVGRSRRRKIGGRRGRGAVNATKHLWAGAVAAMVSRTFVAPLERLKLEYMVRGEQKKLFDLIKTIATTQGLCGFWRGNLINILRTAPFKAINFCANDTYRKQLVKFSGNDETTNFERFIAGAAAGITATVLCLPLDTIRTKLVASGGEALGGVLGAFHHMVQTEGFFSLYKGLVPSIISMAPSGAVFYGVYDILKSAYLHTPEGRKRLQNLSQQGQELNALEQLELGPIRTLLYGAIAGACAEAATYPFEVVRRQLQLQVQATKLSAFGTFVKIVEHGGVTALYAGLVPSLLQVLPSAATSYFVYELMKIVLKVE